MPVKKRPLPQGYWDARKVADEAARRGVFMNPSTVHARFMKGAGAEGVASEVNYPLRRLIVPEQTGIKMIEAEARRQQAILEFGKKVKAKARKKNFEEVKRKLREKRWGPRNETAYRGTLARRSLDGVSHDAFERAESQLAIHLGTEPEKFRQEVIPQLLEILGGRKTKVKLS